MVLAACWVAVALALGAPHAVAFAPLSRAQRTAVSHATGVGSPGSDDGFGRALAQRIAQVKDRQTKLPVVVLDTMLPRQVLRLESADPTFIELVRALTSPLTDGTTFAMVGVHAPHRATGDPRQVPMQVGVECAVVGRPEVVVPVPQPKRQRSPPGAPNAPAASRAPPPPPRVRVTLRAGRRLRLIGEVGVATAGWPEARVAFLRDGADGSDDSDADDVTSTVTTTTLSQSTTTTTTTTTTSGGSRAFDAAAQAAAKARAVVKARAEAEEAELEDVMSNCPPPWARASQLAETFACRPQPQTPSGAAWEGLSLVEQWVALARTKERTVGQIDQLLRDLAVDGGGGRAGAAAAATAGAAAGVPPGALAGMPPPSQPTALALWVGALVNPLPGMGVAREVRPALLLAATAEARVELALAALQQSIGHMRGTQRLW